LTSRFQKNAKDALFKRNMASLRRLRALFVIFVVIDNQYNILMLFDSDIGVSFATRAIKMKIS